MAEEPVASFGLLTTGGDKRAGKRSDMAEERMVSFRLLATGGDLQGFRALEPVGGVDGAATTFFFKLKCTQCGEVTSRDVCLRPTDAEMTLHHPGPCSYAVRRSSAGRYLRRHCFPTCYNPAHIARRCKACGSIGSVELIPAAVSLPATTVGTHVITTLECIGYSPLSFSPGPSWTLTTMTGAQIEMRLVGDTFVGQDDNTNDSMIIKGVKFIFKDA